MIESKKKFIWYRNKVVEVKAHYGENGIILPVNDTKVIQVLDLSEDKFHISDTEKEVLKKVLDSYEGIIANSRSITDDFVVNQHRVLELYKAQK